MKGREYWIERMENTLIESELSVLDYEKALEDAYAYALEMILKEMHAFFQKYAKENKVSYADARKRLTDVERKGFNALLKEWYAEAVEKGLTKEYKQFLQELGKKVYISRLESVEASIRQQIELLKNTQHTGMTELLSVNYLANYYKTYFTFGVGAEMAVRFGTIDSSGVERAIKERWNGRNYSDSIWADKDKLVQTISKILPQAFSRGLNPKILGDMIAKELDTSKNRGRTLARTEVNNLMNQATLDMYKAAGVEKYEYLATLDMRTSEVCRGLDGHIEKISLAKTGINYPPMHPNCRSTTIPVIDGLEEDIEDRIAKDSEGKTIKVPRKMTQEEYIIAYVPKDMQEKLLNFTKKFHQS